MNRTHLEGAAEALAAQQGYAFHTGPEDGMAHTVRSYPAAWLAPLELHAVEGCGHGRATYDMTLHLLSSGARLSPTERRAALARMEEQLLEIFAALSLDERVLAVEGLSVRPRAFALTPHGEISQTAAPPLAATPPRPGSGHGTVRTRESRKRRRGASPP